MLLLFFTAFGFSAEAAQLGVNYYDETLVGGHGLPYIPVSIEQVGRDFDNIKTISNNVKLYLNPYVDANLPWVEQVAAQAEARGMHTVVNIMDDHHQLDAGNWDDYAGRVVNACSALNGKVDEFLVGNEITLHSPMSRTEIRDKVIALMDRCDDVFGGQVSYEEFWYANDVWRGTDRPIYFMMYEDIDAFRTNMAELSANFGSNGYIGEWGEDLLEGSFEYDEQWQKDQIRQRWEIIQASPAPVAYIFTYREPSWTSFSMLRPGTDERRPLWEVFGAPSAPVSSPPPAQPPVEDPIEPPAEQPPAEPEQPVEQPVQPPLVDTPAEQPPVEPPAVEAPEPVMVPTPEPASAPTPEPAPVSVPAPEFIPAPEDISGGSGGSSVGTSDIECNAPGCFVMRDVSHGACRIIDFSTDNGAARALECNDRLFVMSAPRAFSACIDGECVSSAAKSGVGALDVRGPGFPLRDTSEGACRTVTYRGSSVKVCEDADGLNMFLYGSAGVYGRS